MEDYCGGPVWLFQPLPTRISLRQHFAALFSEKVKKLVRVGRRTCAWLDLRLQHC